VVYAVFKVLLACLLVYTCHYDSLGHCIKYASLKVSVNYMYNSSNVMKSIEVGKGVKLVSLLKLN